jgi:hypothetical protein
VQRRTALFQTVVTAVVSSASLIDGLEVVAQDPKDLAKEQAYLKATAQESYQQMDQVRQSLLELLPPHPHRLEYRKRTEIALEIVRELEAEGHFPQAP